MSSAAYWYDLHDLIAACEREFAGPDMAVFPDDADVMHPASGITFGMIRKARVAHDALTVVESSNIDGYDEGLPA